MGSHTLHIQNILMPFGSIPSSYRPCTPQPFIWCVPFHVKLKRAQTHTRTYVHAHRHARTHTNTHKGKQAGAQAGSHTGANQTGFCTRFRSPIRRPPLGAFDSLPSPARLPCPTGMREKVRTLAAELAEQRARRADLQMVLEATHAAWEDARRREVCRGPSATRPPRPAHAGGRAALPGSDRWPAATKARPSAAFVLVRAPRDAIDNQQLFQPNWGKTTGGSLGPELLSKKARWLVWFLCGWFLHFFFILKCVFHVFPTFFLFFLDFPLSSGKFVAVLIICASGVKSHR